MKKFRVTLVDYKNPDNSMALVVMATSIGEAMRSARSGNEGYLVVDPERCLTHNPSSRRAPIKVTGSFRPPHELPIACEGSSRRAQYI